MNGARTAARPVIIALKYIYSDLRVLSRYLSIGPAHEVRYIGDTDGQVHSLPRG